MASRRHIHLQTDRLHLTCAVQVKGDNTCKRFAMKLLRNGIDPGKRQIAPQGRPYYLYQVVIQSRVNYARVMNLIDATEDVELVE